MSFFYLSPVRGFMPVHILEENVLNRLQYLKGILKQDQVPYNEYVVEGSINDNAGHFMLCIAAITSDDADFQQFLVKSEVELFKRRLASLSSYDVRCFVKKLLRSTKKHENVPDYIGPLQILCQHLMLKNIAHHICSSHSAECSKYYITLNFRHCLPFVAKRLVELQNGLVSLPCGRWKQYLILLFTINLKHRLKNKCLSPLKSDPRIKELLLKIRNQNLDLNGNKRCARTELKSKDVNLASANFPPCMLNLHRHLRSKHRLSHFQRFYYSLFLKDIGMPVEEAVDFWRMEYRQNPSGSHSCCHHWEKDEKKYLYGIRHMYGLEGGRKSYSSVSCKRIQDMHVSCSEGGCPFKSFDPENMIKTLNLKPEDVLLSQINELRSRSLYTSACVLFLQNKCKTICDNNLSFNFTPVKFYAMNLDGQGLSNIDSADLLK